MGDKSPKAANKKSSQKKSKADASTQKKHAAEVAKQISVGKK